MCSDGTWSRTSSSMRWRLTMDSSDTKLTTCAARRWCDCQSSCIACWRERFFLMLVQIIYERAFAELEKDLASQRADVEKHNQVCHRICAWKSVFVLQEVLLGGPIPPGTQTRAHTHTCTSRMRSYWRLTSSWKSKQRQLSPTQKRILWRSRTICMSKWNN